MDVLVSDMGNAVNSRYRLSINTGNVGVWKRYECMLFSESDHCHWFLQLAFNHPSDISTADDVNIIGHNLNGVKSILKPVNMDTTARTRRKHDVVIYVAIEIVLTGSIKVIIATRTPTNINVTPSIIHSILIIFLLSWLISPNP